MAADEIHVGDVGVEFTVTIMDGSSTVDISTINTTTGRQFLFRDSNGNVSTVTAALVGTGSTGSLIYTSTSSTFATDGAYSLQAVITLGNNTFHTDIYKFTVHPNLS